MRIRHGLFLCALLTLCLMPLWGAQADGSYGTRTYASYSAITLSASSSVADAVDWLEDFIGEEVGGAMEIATDLMELVELNDENAYALALLDPADRPTESDIADAYQAFEDASDFNSEIRYYYDRLIYLYNQNASDRQQILSGELTPAEIERLKLDMAVNDEETVSLMTVVINQQVAWTLTLTEIQASLDGLDIDNTYITHIRNQAALVLADQADAIAAIEAASGEEPVVNVISDKEIAICVTGVDGKTQLSNISVTLNCKGQGGATKATDSTGTVVFWMTDFKPNDEGVVEVEVSINGTSENYQRRELGVIQLSGGDILSIPLRKDDGNPYVVKATFDDADMMTVANGMYLTPKNDIDHTIELKVETKGKAVNVKAWYRPDFYGWKALLSENFAAGDTAARTVTRKWMQKGTTNAFPEETPIYLTVEIGSGEAFDPAFSDDYEKDKMVFLCGKSNLDEPASGTETSKEKTGEILGKFQFTLPKDWPVIGGANIKIPLETGFDYVMEIGKSFELGYNYKVQHVKRALWKSENLKQQKKRLKQQSDKNANILKSTANGVKNDYMAHKTERLLGSAKASVTPFLYMELEYNFKSNHGVGNIHFGVDVMFKLSLTRQFMVGPVPAFIGLKLKLKVTVGITTGLSAHVSNKGVPSDFKFSDETGVNIGIHLKIEITVGAGLPRIAYVGLRGCGWIKVQIILNLHTPDPVWQLGLRAQVVVKVLFFTKEWTLWQYVYPEHSGLSTPLLAEEWENTPTSQTISLEEALSADNLGAPNATAAESDLIQSLPITGGDVRYVRVWDNLSYAFWIGRSTKNSDRTRLMYYRFDPTSSESGTFGEVVFGEVQNSMNYTYEFDVDVYQGCVYIAITTGNNEVVVLPDNPDQAIKLMRDMQQGTHLVTGVFDASSNDPSIIDGTIIYEPHSNMIYVPRIRAIPVSGTKYFYAYGAINIDCNVQQDMYYYKVCVGYTSGGLAIPTLRLYAANYYMPDFQLLNVMISGDRPSPLAMVLVQSRKDANHSEMYLVTDNQDNEESKPVTSLNFSTMSAPFWADRNDPKSNVGILLVKNDPDNSAGTGATTGTLCTLFISNLSSGVYSDIRNSITVKDMGVSISADGALPLSVQATSSQNQMYAYWVQGQPGAQQGTLNAYADTYVINACLIDMKNKLTSPAFPWISLEKKVDKLYLMPVRDLSKPVIGYYLAPSTNSEGKVVSYGIRKLNFQLQTGLRILTFSTDNSAVTQGQDFGMYFQLENTGSLVVKGVRINVKAKKIGNESDEVLIKNIHIDMSDPQLNAVEHFDVLGTTGRTTQGAFTVYRIYDTADAYNGNLVVTHEYGADTTDTLSVTEYLKGMMPGNIATFKTTVTNSPTKWKGKYALYAEIVGIDYTLSLGSLEDAEVGTVTRVDDPSGADTFIVTDPGSESVAAGLFGYTSPTPAESSAQTNLSNNTALNDTLTTGDARYADIGYNNLSINADMVWVDGVPYASVTLDNSCNAASPLITPVLVAQVLNADGTYSVTYSRALHTTISDGFTRSLMIPLSTLLNGCTYYEDLKLSIGSVLQTGTPTGVQRLAAVDYEAGAEALQETSVVDAGELNETNNHDTLLLSNTFFYVQQPVDQTVMAGETATFTSGVVGMNGPFTYRWQVRYPDGSYYDVPGGTDPVLTLPDAQTSQQGLVYWVMAADSTGRALMSDTATLYVRATPTPETGDSSNLTLWIVLFAASAAALGLLCLRILRGRRRP